MQDNHDARPFPIDRTALLVLERTGENTLVVWEPPGVCVVAGRASILEHEIHLDRCSYHGIPVYRRRGGGASVVLSPGMLVITLAVKATWGAIPTLNENLAQAVATAVTEAGGKPVHVAGHGDLVLADRKVLGASLYFARAHHTLLYQASLLLAPELELVFRYLKHPPSEPSYRKFRCHREFLTTFKNEGVHLCRHEMQGLLRRSLGGLFGGHLRGMPAEAIALNAVSWANRVQPASSVT